MSARQQGPAEPQARADLAIGALVIIVAVVAVLLAAVYFYYPKQRPGATAQVRVLNQTGVPLQNVRINGRPFGDLAAGAATPYQDLRPAYRYADLQLVIDGKPVRLRPDDYVGEATLGKGRFSYRIARGESAAAGVVQIQAVAER